MEVLCAIVPKRNKHFFKCIYLTKYVQDLCVETLYAETLMEVKNKVVDAHSPDFKTYFKTTVIKTV